MRIAVSESRVAAGGRFHRQDGDLETTTEIAVVPDDGAEVRRLVRRHRERTERLVEPLLALIVLAWWRRIFLS